MIPNDRLTLHGPAFATLPDSSPVTFPDYIDSLSPRNDLAGVVVSDGDGVLTRFGTLGTAFFEFLLAQDGILPFSGKVASAAGILARRNQFARFNMLATASLKGLPLEKIREQARHFVRQIVLKKDANYLQLESGKQPVFAPYLCAEAIAHLFRKQMDGHCVIVASGSLRVLWEVLFEDLTSVFLLMKSVAADENRKRDSLRWDDLARQSMDVRFNPLILGAMPLFERVQATLGDATSSSIVLEVAMSDVESPLPLGMGKLAMVLRTLEKLGWHDTRDVEVITDDAACDFPLLATLGAPGTRFLTNPSPAHQRFIETLTGQFGVSLRFFDDQEAAFRLPPKEHAALIKQYKKSRAAVMKAALKARAQW